MLQPLASLQVPELLPEAVTAVATKALQKVGVEVAAAGAADGSEAAQAAAEAQEGDGDGGVGTGGVELVAEAAVTPEVLPDLWQQELEAWSMLLDGSALNDHMEVI